MLLNQADRSGIVIAWTNDISHDDGHGQRADKEEDTMKTIISYLLSAVCFIGAMGSFAIAFMN
jgi:hypothetical protein